MYVVQPDDTVELRTIKPGIVEGAETAIESGLSPGEIVVTEGVDKLQTGTQITTREKEKDKDKDKDKAAGPSAANKPAVGQAAAGTKPLPNAEPGKKGSP